MAAFWTGRALVAANFFFQRCLLNWRDGPRPDSWPGGFRAGLESRRILQSVRPEQRHRLLSADRAIGGDHYRCVAVMAWRAAQHSPRPVSALMLGGALGNLLGPPSQWRRSVRFPGAAPGQHAAFCLQLCPISRFPRAWCCCWQCILPTKPAQKIARPMPRSISGPSQR